MEFGAEYTFDTPEQFWAELEDHAVVPPNASLDELDYALRSYVAFLSVYLDEYLSAPGSLEHAVATLLTSALFRDHEDRMTLLMIAHIAPTSSPSTLFIALIVVLRLGLLPISDQYDGTAHAVIHSTADRKGQGSSSKVFKAMRKKWHEVVPVLMKSVEQGGVVAQLDQEGAEGMPRDGWEERAGTAAATVLYEVCRVQRLNVPELSLFTELFIARLFALVETTRNALDETFNYTLIKLLIALNEQFMMQAIHSGSSSSSSGIDKLPPPILPTIVGERTAVKDPNLVLEVLRSNEVDSKTFGENIIFILNRNNGSPDSLCVSLLILKILYLLFTTSGTHEYFYTNDLCVLVDVFIRELCDLGEESEGLKHTYLRVLHPLLNNTQLRHHPYKRPQLRRILNSLVTPSAFRTIDGTTKRLVDRCLRGSWCDGLLDVGGAGADGAEKRVVFRQGSGVAEVSTVGMGWSSGMGGRREEPRTRASSSNMPRAVSGSLIGLRDESRNGSTLSVDAVAAVDGSHLPVKRHRKVPSIPDSPGTSTISLPAVSEYLSPPSTPGVLAPRARSSSLLVPTCPSSSNHSDESSRPSSAGPGTEVGRRRAAPPPPAAMSATALADNRPTTPSGRRAAPRPPADRLGTKIERLTVS